MDFLSNWFKNLTSEDVARWVRTIAQFLAGSGFGVGVLTGDKWVALGGALVSLISFIFTLRGNTVAAKTAEVKKSDEVNVTPTAAATPAVVAATKS